jgi:hypothetical protein
LYEPDSERKTQKRLPVWERTAVWYMSLRTTILVRDSELMVISSIAAKNMR